MNSSAWPACFSAERGGPALASGSAMAASGVTAAPARRRRASRCTRRGRPPRIRRHGERRGGARPGWRASRGGAGGGGETARRRRGTDDAGHAARREVAALLSVRHKDPTPDSAERYPRSQRLKKVRDLVDRSVHPAFSGSSDESKSVTKIGQKQNAPKRPSHTREISFVRKGRPAGPPASAPRDRTRVCARQRIFPRCFTRIKTPTSDRVRHPRVAKPGRQPEPANVTPPNPKFGRGPWRARRASRRPPCSGCSPT